MPDGFDGLVEKRRSGELLDAGEQDAVIAEGVRARADEITYSNDLTELQEQIVSLGDRLAADDKAAEINRLNELSQEDQVKLDAMDQKTQRLVEKLTTANRRNLELLEAVQATDAELERLRGLPEDTDPVAVVQALVDGSNELLETIRRLQKEIEDGPAGEVAELRKLVGRHAIESGKLLASYATPEQIAEGDRAMRRFFDEQAGGSG